VEYVKPSAVLNEIPSGRMLKLPSQEKDVLCLLR
jgi:hypothetical protein